MTTTNTPFMNHEQPEKVNTPWMTNKQVYILSIKSLGNSRHSFGQDIRDKAQEHFAPIVADLTAKLEAKDEENTEYAFELQKYEGIVVNLQSENATLRKEVERLKGVVHRLNIDSILKRGEQLELTPFDFDELKAEITRLKEDLEGWHELASKKDAELTVALLQSDTLKAEVERLKGEFREK